MVVLNPTTLIEVGKSSFLITDAPSTDNLVVYIETLKDKGVTDLVRTCELTYPEDQIISAGINCHDLAFPDGDPPPNSVLKSWLELVETASNQRSTIAIHCVAGLGRAPVLVAIALIESGIYNAIESVEYLRSRRRGAINRKQLQYLSEYHPQTKRVKRKRLCCF